MPDSIVEVDNVSMLFNLKKEKSDNLKEYVIRLLKGNLHIEKFWALRNISLQIKRGESLAILGFNGSGKSTLLKLIAGVFKPAEGQIRVFGSVAPLIELGAGFDAELTARENIYLNGAVLGYSRKQMNARFAEIMDFSELHEFVDVPIKNYSSGMVARLGFSIATVNNPDILIVDEILGVGDQKFQKKCGKRIESIMAGGTTVILVSHSIDTVRELCARAILLEKGKMVASGKTDEVCEAYIKSMV